VRQSALYKQVIKAKPPPASTAAYPSALCLDLLHQAVLQANAAAFAACGVRKKNLFFLSSSCGTFRPKNYVAPRIRAQRVSAVLTRHQASLKKEVGHISDKQTLLFCI
jgi:hypothetical protein